MAMRMGIAAAGLAAGIGMAAPVCDLVFEACPGRFAGTTITVPEEAIWLSPRVAACDDTAGVRTPGSASPPSIVFIIDNSGSMSKGQENTSSGGNDPDEARFTVVQSLLDTLYAASPAAEVGMVIFTRRLAFDHRDNPFFRSAFPGDSSQHDSFVPLTPLNRIFPDGARGLDTLKKLLEFTGNGNLIHHTRLPGSRPNEEYGALSTRDGTDITLGFEAAKVAMAGAKAPPGDRYFIFLSDGEPAYVDEGRDGMEDDFIDGKGAPTTFTVYFQKGDNPEAPDNIVEMTENIRRNGYSASNPKSNHWAINLPGSQLSALLQSSVLDTILSPATSSPKSATLEAGGVTQADSAAEAGLYVFPKRVPLSRDRTEIVVTYTYSVAEAGVTREVSIPYSLDIRRSANAPALSEGLALECRENAGLKVGYLNPVARVPALASPPGKMHWILDAPESMKPATGAPARCCAYAGDNVEAGDSLRHAGVVVEAGGPFRADIRIYTNLGQFVNRVALTVPETEFPKLDAVAGTGMRRLKILWGNRAEDGTLAGTGAYVFKAKVSLLRPMVGGEAGSWSGYRVFGVLRE